MAALEPRGRDLGDALLSWWSPQVDALGLTCFSWSKQMTAQPGYPCNPRTECPRVLFRMYRMDHDDGKTMCQTAFTYVCSAWYQRRQVPGENHQALLVADLDALQKPLTDAKLVLTNVLSRDWIRNLQVIQCQALVRDELKHPKGDPSMTVSVGEVNLILEGEYK